MSTSCDCDFGFIITRHVNSAQTNRYWNQCVKLIRTFYPMRQIVIIDDNSKQEFVHADHNYQFLTVVASEFPGRGELLPYLYFAKYKWFPHAVILHDSVFIHKRIPFESFKVPVIPLWHHGYDKENLHNIVRICRSLKNSNTIINKLTRTSALSVMGMPDNSVNGNFNLIFGAMTFISLRFLLNLQQKYQLVNLVPAITNRPDRCSFERIIGAIIHQEYPQTISVFGDIAASNNSFTYTFDQYMADLKNKRIRQPFVKVWTGR